MKMFFVLFLFKIHLPLTPPDGDPKLFHCQNRKLLPKLSAWWESWEILLPSGLIDDYKYSSVLEIIIQVPNYLYNIGWIIAMSTHLKANYSQLWCFWIRLFLSPFRYMDLSVQGKPLSSSSLSDKLLQYKATLRFYDTVEHLSTDSVLWLPLLRSR